HRTGGTETGESGERQSKHDGIRGPPGRHSKRLSSDGNHLRIAPRSAAHPQWPSALEVIPPSTHTRGALILGLFLLSDPRPHQSRERARLDLVRIRCPVSPP